MLSSCQASRFEEKVVPLWEKDLEKISPLMSMSAPQFPAALLCACTNCLQANYTCETDGACMVSIFNLDGMEHHVRTCIPKVELVPAGKPFYCLSSEDLRNTHCCYTDYCNRIDLRVPSGECTPLLD
ncbi:Activin receptor type-1B [Saguinus oedipus]|uniref:Activin receptor type-1B n=1 Tax=Saguinus oedipus TaxID=9490 RepID=A0ABQ9T9W6_SAGOE|nr:Activin receptor type-1B [Saguinus oedipus]